MDCCGKMTVRDEDKRRSLINRLNRIEGQIRGIKAMVEEDRYCGDILVQSSAVAQAINAFNREILDGHVKGCVVRDIKDGREDVVDELIGLVHKLLR